VNSDLRLCQQSQSTNQTINAMASNLKTAKAIITIAMQQMTDKTKLISFNMVFPL
jgi:hypothetical protein